MTSFIPVPRRSTPGLKLIPVLLALSLVASPASPVLMSTSKSVAAVVVGNEVWVLIIEASNAPELLKSIAQTLRFT